MKWLEFVLQPTSFWGSELRGDTLFGHLAWQIAHDSKIYPGGIEALCKDMQAEPILVCSSGILRWEESSSAVQYFFPRPLLPLHWLFSIPTGTRSKLIKRKKWLRSSCISQLQVNSTNLLADAELPGAEKPTAAFATTRNSIARTSLSTAGSDFAPYQVDGFAFRAGYTISIIVAHNEQKLSQETLTLLFNRLGQAGYGKDAALGWGTFSIAAINELQAPPPPKPGRYSYLTGPMVSPTSMEFELFGQLETYVGRHGSTASHYDHVVKTPLLLSLAGSVAQWHKAATPTNILGAAQRAVSSLIEGAIHSGYTVALPLELEVHG